MKKLLSLVGMLVAVLLSGCQAEYQPPPIEGMDWCYLFNFVPDQQGFSVSAGAHIGRGIVSDDTGLLTMSYGYDRDVYPSYVTVSVLRPEGVAGDIKATTAGTVFGVSTYFTATLTADLDSALLTFAPNPNGEEFIGDRSDINITVDASQRIIIESINVLGMGGTPFPYNSCSDTTPTTTPGDPGGTGTPFGTGTPTQTGTPSGTGTPTQTVTPGPSPTPGIQCDFDFTISSQGWLEALNQGALYDPGAGFGRGAVNTRVYIFKEITGTITSVRLWFSEAIPNGRVDLFSSGSSTHTISGTNPTISGLSITGGLAINLKDNVTDAVTATFRLTRVTVTGSGCTPPTPTPGPTNTPAATNTPVGTNTPEPLWSACMDFTADRYGFVSTDADYVDGLGWVQGIDPWALGRIGLPNTQKKKFKITFANNEEFAGSIRATDGGVNATAWELVYGNGVAIVDFTGGSWIPTTNFYLEMDIGFRPYIIESICWLDPNPSTGTPVPGVGTLTRTPLPSVTAPPALSRTPIQIPVPIIYITSTPGVIIVASPIYGGTGVYSPSGTPSSLITGTPGTEGTPYGEGDGTGFGSGGGGFGDAGDMLGFGWNIGWGLFGTLIAYLGQAGTIVSDLLTAFTNAVPQPIPGLPLCMSNPRAHDLCAVYYILDWTLFATATPGALIIPLLLIIMNINIAIYFVRWVLKIIRRGESVTNAP